MLCNFSCFGCCLLTEEKLFQKIIQEHYQSVKLNQSLLQVYIHTVYKGCQQMTKVALARKELNVWPYFYKMMLSTDKRLIMLSLLVHLSRSYNNIYSTILYTVLVKRKKHISRFCKKKATGKFSILWRNIAKNAEQGGIFLCFVQNVMVFLHKHKNDYCGLNMNK